MYNNCFHLTTKELKLFVCVISKTFSKSVFKCFHLEFPCEAEAEEVEVEGVI